MKTSALTKSTAWYTLGNLFVRSANFLLLPLYSNFITPDDFGNYALLMSFYSIAMVLYQGGYQTALNKFYHQESDVEKQQVVFTTIARIVIGIGLSLSVLVIFASGALSELIFDTNKYSGLIILIAGAMFLETAGNQVINYLVTVQNASKVVFVTGTEAVINFILNIYFIYFLEMGIEGIIIAQLISVGVLIIILSPILLKVFKSRIDLTLSKSLFVFILPLMISGLLSIGVDVADRFILNHFLGKADVGIYSFSYRIALVMNLFVISFRTAWMPYSIKLYYDGALSDLFGRTLLKYVAAAGIILISVSLLTGDLFDVKLGGYNLFKEVYRSGVYIIPFILGAYFLNGIISFFSVYPFVSNKTFHFIISDGTAFLINIILNFILIPHYGLIGAAAATLLSFTAGASYLIIISNKNLLVKYPLKKIASVLGIVIVLTLAGSLIDNLIADILLIGFFLMLLILGLKIRPVVLFTGNRINERN